MPFKLIECVEDGEKMICVVPNQWELRGVLYWPNAKFVDNLRKNEMSKPNPNWSKQNCRVIKDHIKSFSEAMKLEKYWANFSGTEDEEDFHKQKTIQRKHPTLKLIENQVDLNYLIEKDSEDAELVKGTENIINLQSNQDQDLNHFLNAATVDAQIEFIEDTIDTSSPSLISTESESTGGIGKNLGNQDILAEIIKNQENMLNTILERMKEMDSKIDGIQKCVNGINLKFVKLSDIVIDLCSESQGGRAEVPKKPNISFHEKLPIIDNEDDLNLLEKNLGCSEFRQNFIDEMSMIGGKSGDKSGVKIAYLLMDELFQRKFLTKVSWTGSSRQKDVKKISFIKFRNIHDVLFKILNLADSRFTFDDTNAVIKRILKNANTRVNAKKCLSDSGDVEEIVDQVSESVQGIND